MRKFLAAFLAVLMLASVLTVAIGAEDSENGFVTFDYTVAADTDKMSLVVTEVMVDPQTDLDQVKSLDAFEYIEVYNRGTTPISMSSLGIASCTDTNLTTAPWQGAVGKHTFEKYVNLMAGNVYDDAALNGLNAGQKNAAWPLSNPSSAGCMLQPGQFALIWIWNNDTNKYFEALYDDGEITKSSKAAFEKFREFYGSAASMSQSYYEKAVVDPDTGLPALNEDGTQKTEYVRGIPEDTLIMVAMAATEIGGNSTANSASFGSLVNSANTIYAFYERDASNTNVMPFSALTQKPNNRVLCMFRHGVNNKGGIPSNLTNAYEGMSTIYVTPDQDPYLANRILAESAEAGTEPVQYTNYIDYDIATHWETSYKEMGIFAYWEYPTPGTMMAYQWERIDPDAMPETAKMFSYDGNEFGDVKFTGEVAENWKEQLYQALETQHLELGEDVAGEPEDRVEVVYKNREDLGNKGDNKQKTKKKKSLPIGALIGIIAGAVVLLGAIAVVVIILVKKKNKPVASDDVAAEGDVQIIDESTGETPAENNESVNENKPE